MIAILNVSPRKGGLNDLISSELHAGFEERGLPVTAVNLRDLDIRSCSNCRSCMKTDGNSLGTCYIADDLDRLIEPLLSAETIIVTSPINCYDLPSGFQVMLERFAVFCYWSDDMYAPKVRPSNRRKNGFLITTSALPGVMVPILTTARKTFRLFTKPMGITKVDYCHLGFKGRQQDRTYTEKDRASIRKVIEKTMRLNSRQNM